jgi:hypothetical protein
MRKITSLFAVLLVLGPVAAFADANITLIGSNPDHVYTGHSYIDPGYSAFSTVDGDITKSVVTSLVNTANGGWTTRSYSVTDSEGIEATASRRIEVRGSSSGTMPYCSGPMAPGWRIGEIGGGCGEQGVFIESGRSAVVRGELKTCPAWFPSGCIVN